MKNRIIVLGMVLAWGGAVLGACDDSTSLEPRPPAAPTNLAAATTSASEITLTWQDNSDNEASFVIERCSGVGCGTFVEIATVGANTTGYQDQGLTPGVSYSYRICAHNAGGDSEYSNTATVATVVAPPVAPTDLAVWRESWLGRGGFGVWLRWQDNSDNEEGFIIERCIGWRCTAFTPLDTVPWVSGSTWNYFDSRLGALSPRSYRVRAYNAEGSSGYSNTVSAGPPVPPSNLMATAGSATQIALTWQDNSGNEASFDIERCTGAGCTGFSRIATVAANTTSYQDEGLTGGTSYSYRVRVNSRLGPLYSNYSNTATAATL